MGTSFIFDESSPLDLWPMVPLMVRSALLLLLLASPTATSLRVASNRTAPLRSRAGHTGGGSAATTGDVRSGQPCGSAAGQARARTASTAT